MSGHMKICCDITVASSEQSS